MLEWEVVVDAHVRGRWGREVFTVMVMINTVVICTNLSGKEAHRQIGLSLVVISGILVVVMVSTLARNARHSRYLLSISHFRHTFSNTIG